MQHYSGPSGVPEKFSASGEIQIFRGNTIIAHLPPRCPLIPPLCFLYAYITKHPFNSKFALLPPSSWHMTVIEGVTDAYRHSEDSPQGMNDWTVEEYTSHITSKLKALGADLHRAGLAPPYHMKLMGCQDIENGISLRVEPATAYENCRIRRLRDKIAAEAFGFRHPSHDVYEFHVSVAYLLQKMEDKEKANLKTELEEQIMGLAVEFELGSPEFCLFDNMYAFDRQFYLYTAP